jgi:spermidine/putrescine-binding protein
VRLKPQLKVLSTSIGDQETLMLGGDVDVELVGLTWFVHDARGKGNTDIQFAVPKEGAFGFVDAVFITPWAKNRQNALAYASALTSGDSAVAMCESVYQLNTNPSVTAKLNSELLGQFPSNLDEYATKTLKFNKFWYDPNGKYATVEEWRKVWDEVKALG